jgi:hypothetical protein
MAFGVGRLRPLKRVSISQGNENRPPATLRHAVIGSLDYSTIQSIPCVGLTVDACEHTIDGGDRIVAPAGKTRDVLYKNGLRTKHLDQLQEVSKALRSMVFESSHASVRPLGGLRERLARWAPCQDVEFASAQPQVARAQGPREFRDITRGQRLPVGMISGDCGAGDRVDFDTGDRPEACSREAEV